MARAFFTAASLLIAGLIATSQPPDRKGTTPAPVRPEPKLPGAVTRIPDGIGPGAPFDVAAFFATLPAELNAQPLYLDALFEFDPSMAVCFPAGAETTRRKQVAERRQRVLNEAIEALNRDRNAVSNQG